MKKTALVLMIAAIAAATSAQAEVNVNIGVPAPRVVVSAPPAVMFDVAPHFIAPSRLGFYVGVDTPYDIFLISDVYYLYYGNRWLRARHHNGPWVEVPYRQLPPGIRKHRIEQIRSYRDREYRVYRDEQDRYRGRHFQPGHERKEHLKEERRRDREELRDDRRRGVEERKNERRQSREELKDENRRGREERNDGRRQGREERKEEKRDREPGRPGRD
jgi:hypothetical protein